MATTTPNYGWPVPTSTDYVKDGATAIEALGDAIDATVFSNGTPALKFVKSQVVGTGVSSVTVTNCFSSAYTNYKVLYTDGTTVGTAKMQLTGITSGYGYASPFQFWSPTTLSGRGAASAASFDAADLTMNYDIYNPNLAKYKSGTGMWNDAVAMVWGAFYNASTVQSTGFTLSATSMTGGTIYVYGYGKS